MSITTQVHEGLTCINDQCELGALCHITAANSAGQLTKYSTYLYQGQSDLDLFPRAVKFIPTDDECLESVRLLNQKMLWFHLHATGSTGKIAVELFTVKGYFTSNFGLYSKTKST